MTVGVLPARFNRLMRLENIPLNVLTKRILIAVGIFNILFMIEHSIASDGIVRWDFLDHFLSEGKLVWTKFSIIGPLFSAPLWYLGKLMDNRQHAFVSYYNSILFIAGIIVMRRYLKEIVSSTIIDVFTLLLLAASMFPHHASLYFGEVFSSLLFFIGLLRLARSHDDKIGWVLLVLATVNMPATIAGLSLVCCYYVFSEKRLRYVVPLLLALCLVLLENWLKWGNPLRTGYEGDHGFQTAMPYSGMSGFSYPMMFGILSILFSFGKGLVIFAPGLLLFKKDAFQRPDPLRRLLVTSLWYLVGLILFYSKWWAWYGGGFWGPRFFLFASLPASLLLAIAICRKISTVFQLVMIGAILTLSVWVGINGMIFKQYGLDVCFKDNYALEAFCWYTPEYSALWHPFAAGGVWRTLRQFPGYYGMIVYIALMIQLLGSVSSATYENLYLRLVEFARSLKAVKL